MEVSAAICLVGVVAHICRIGDVEGRVQQTTPRAVMENTLNSMRTCSSARRRREAANLRQLRNADIEDLDDFHEADDGLDLDVEGAAVPHLALNNISKIEGLRSCEFLNKLDLTVYPVDFNTGGELITPSLCSISRGVLHTRQPSESNSETGLREYAATSTRRQGDPPPQGAAAVSRSTTVPHMKREMYMEMAEQEEEARRCENQPKERSTKAEHETEHEEVLRKDRLQEMDPFSSATKTNGHIHPSYVFVVAKNKVLRLNFSEFVRLDAGTATCAALQLYREDQGKKLKKGKVANKKKTT
ncbi:hypothetical protein PF008_g17552 [Phytophthora fragariae]|uniref:Uncharacterized protein n=1 Tax=Phytophthora fragariae TaxID=53985 RepID=A0A6G0R7X7_9STRA|nr:hypothetical protein PF008_g17552 [Phytophthora fragariae]